MLAVSEVAANTLRHTQGAGAAGYLADRDEIVCEIRDGGSSPTRHRPGKPGLDAPGGHGLWLVYQVCDEVELTSGPDGTTIRMHMLLQPPAERD